MKTPRHCLIPELATNTELELDGAAAVPLVCKVDALAATLVLPTGVPAGAVKISEPD